MIRTALVIVAVLSALNGGVFFAFSDFLMRALDRLGPDAATRAFRAINIVVITPTFMTLLFGTGVAAVGAAALAYRDGMQPWLAVAGAVIYAVGCIGVTMFGNVPLNNALAATQPMAWQSFQPAWTRLNHVRTIACVAASIAFAAAAVRSAS